MTFKLKLIFCSVLNTLPLGDKLEPVAEIAEDAGCFKLNKKMHPLRIRGMPSIQINDKALDTVDGADLGILKAY